MSAGSAGRVNVEPAADPTRQGPPVSRRGMVVGVLLVVLALLGFGLWVDHEARQISATGPLPPEIVLLEPTNGATVSGPLELVFEAEAELRRGPGGWQSGPFHIHAAIDEREIMPGGDDIRRVSGIRYIWTIRSIPPGQRTLRLFWSDHRHQEVAGGGSRAVRVNAVE
ncbi:hypothetical protein BH23GEM3_BH23GEM3_07440 [soil metagenome]|nr:hypothetical protein [Gemmatimonadota bacterium]